MTAKACIRCGETKPLEAFYRHSQMGDGRLNKCIDCTKRDVRLHRLRNPEAVREYDRQRSSLPHRVQGRRANQARYSVEHPDRRKAQVTLNNAVRDKRVAKGPCAFCGAEQNVEAHHHDYTKPLDVTWLCKPCHRRFHALERMATYREDAA